MTKENRNINICHRDHENEVPLIFTFAFPGAEFWCPVCGFKCGMFGVIEMVPATEKLDKLEIAYRDRATPYLNYMSSKAGARIEDENGNLVPYEAPPAEYKYNNPIKLED